MHPSARLIVRWTIRHRVRLIVHGHADDDALERLERVLDLLARAGATHITVDLTGLDGRDAGVLAVLATMWDRLARRGGELHVVGLRRRMVTGTEVGPVREARSRSIA